MKEIVSILTTIIMEKGNDSLITEIISKIEKQIQLAEKNKDKCLWSFYWDCGREGELEGVFKATKKEIKDVIGKKVNFGEILGKHSEIYGELEEDDISLTSTNPIEVIHAEEGGYNPLDYVEYNCRECECNYCIDEFDIEKGLCNYCIDERDKAN